MFTGSDGSQTGTASFLGNFTAIAQPSGNYFFMLRMTDCSLFQFAGSSALTGSFNIGSYASNYEHVLHQLASLKTTDDVYPQGCVESSTGMSSRVGVALARNASGAVVFATAEGNGNNNAVFILSISADLSTTTFTSIASLTAASGLSTADLNGDGNGDLVVVNDYNATSAYVSVALGNGDGTFQTPVNYPIAGNMSVAAVIEDVNNDGKLDIVAVSDTQQISVLLGNGDGTFQAAQSFAAPALPGYTSNTYTPILGLITADVNGDGKKDIICSDGVVLLGNGNGTFTPVATPAFPYTTDNPGGFGPGMASGDINNDGKVDLVVDTGSTIFTYLGKGNGTFTPGTSYAAINNSGYVTVSDLDGDGNLDIYNGLADGGIYSGDDTDSATAYVLMGNGDGTFVGAPQVTGVYTGNNLGDVNGDGVLDLITNATGPYNTPGPVFTVQLGTTKGAFNPVSTITAPASFNINAGNTLTGANVTTATTYAVADLNGDGKADLVFLDSNLTDTYIPGSGFFRYAGPVLFVALSNGDGTFQTPVPYAFPQIAPAPGFDIGLAVDGLQVADFNKDGHNDLLFTFNETGGGTGIPPYSEGFVLLPGIGDGTFGTPILTTTYSGTTAPPIYTPPEIAAVADINNDGKLDLLVVTPTGSGFVGFVLDTQLEVFLGKGDGTFTVSTTPVTSAVNPRIPASPGTPYSPCILIDFNKDTKLDLACLGEAANSQGQLAISLGNGDGTFAAPTIFNLSGGDTVRNASLAAADFNADGNVDLALINANDTSGIFYGKGDGTFTSVPTTSYVFPKDLINVGVGSPAVATDLNHDGKPDILAGSTILLNLYGAAPVIPATTSLGLTASASTIAPGGSITLAATVTPAPGSTATPTGTVTFYNGTTAVGTGIVSSDVATLTTTALTTAGSDNISATYSGDTNYSGSPSVAVIVTITAATKTTPTVTVSPSSSGITTAQALTVTVSVTGPIGATTTATGSVTLTGAGYTSTATTLTNGSVPINIPAGSLATGLDTLTANYTPDSASSSTYNSASGTASVTVTALASVPNVVGLTQAAASSAITGAGLTVGTVTTASSSTVPSGSVISQSPIAGSSVAAGSAVNLVVSTGPAPSGFGVSASPSTLSLIAGATTGNTAAITLVQVGSFSGSVTLSCAVTTAPAGATSPATCSLSPTTAVTVPGGTGPTLTVTSAATTTAGAYTVTVTGTSGTTTASTVVNITVTSATGTGTFSVQSGSPTVSVSGPGVSGTTTIVVNPSGGFTGSVALTAAVTSSPAGAQDLPTLSFGSTSPVSITGTAAGIASLTISTTAASAGALTTPERPGVRWYSATGAALACLLFIGLPSRRRSLRTMLGLLVFLGILAGGVIGCGGQQNTETTGSTGTTPGSYIVTVTGATGNTTAQTTFTFTVN
jgi:hypothetical protein